MKRFPFALASLVLCGTLAYGADVPAKTPLPPAVGRKVDFAADIQPILAKTCFSCHGAAKQRGGLRLDDETAALKGSNSGPVLQPGNAAESRLFQAVAGLDPDFKMPPDGKPGLTNDQLGLVRTWIDQGAKWSGAASTTAAPTPRSNHWAFQPVRRPALPAVDQKSWVRNEIDAFILARLEKEKIIPSPEADRPTLLRRLSLDLLGLPPSPEEVDAFVADSRPDAYERLVDCLLDSPHYGERWGRHWLDLARYADSDGFEKDNPRPHAWHFRNWVIDALNRDLPFDRFTVEQLAGDLLPGATLEQKIATGFHRNTLTNTEGGVDQEQYRVEACVDRVNTTAKVFLGVTLGCAQCHDHKYDPFSHREYYQFFAFFNSDQEINLLAPPTGEEAATARKKAEYDKKLAELQGAVKEYTAKKLTAAQQEWEQNLKVTELRSVAGPEQAVLLLDPTKRTAEQQQMLAAYYAKIDRKLVSLSRAVADFQKAAPFLDMAQTLALGPGRQTHVMLRGDFLRPGIEVQPGMPAVLGPLPQESKLTRLDLARWIVDAKNPLTARVTVNWVWHKYFGRGIVPTLEDFGTQGERPSHPELLDWLASEFGARQWGLKELHKLIVTSATYRQSSKARPELAQRDSVNVLLARQSRLRLEAETIRDVMLATSGLLVRNLGGPSVRPPQPPGIAELTYGSDKRWTESNGPDRFRRGLYTWFQRTAPFPMLITFDAPDGNLCCVRRDRSNTPLQALTLLNDVTFVECAQALGSRLATGQPGDARECVRCGVRLSLGREPTATELDRLVRLFEELRTLCQTRPEEAAKLVGKMQPAGVATADAAAWIALARTLLNLDEMVTRE